MVYAVVLFKKENQVSEVPSNWLLDCKKKCYWPPSSTKNITSLIKNRVEPTSSWDIYDVEMEGLYGTLEKAVKKARNEDYTSSEEMKGKGKRKKFSTRKNVNSSSSGEEFADDRVSPPPKFLQPFTNHDKEYTRPTSRDVSPSSIGMALNNNLTESCSNNLIYDSASYTDQSPVSKIDSIPVIILPASPDIGNEELDQFLGDNVTEVPDLGKAIELPADENKIDRLMRMVASLLLQVEDLNRKFDAQVLQANPQSWEYFKQVLPCNDNDKVHEVDAYLASAEERKLEFMKFIQSIGGLNAKDKVNRVMKTLLTNRFGTLCSWLGQRNHIRVKDFKCITYAQAALAPETTQFEFEKHAAEWLRLSRMRWTREAK